MPAIIETHNLVKKYNTEFVVKGINLKIQQGEIFCLLGPNGAGKTTTISMLSGLLKPTGGDAVIQGLSITKEPISVKNCIGVVPQEIALYASLSARSNLMFWGRMYGLGGQALKHRVNEVIDQIGVSDRADDKIQTYSGGMKRRVNIGVSLLHKPQVLFMDEPTVGIDPQSRRNILDAVKELNRQGTTVLYTTHYMEEAEEISDRIGIIDHGRLVAIGSKQELTQLVDQHITLRLHFSHDQDVSILLKRLEEEPDIIQASLVNHCIDIAVLNAEKSLPLIFPMASDLGINIRSVDIQELNLEAVFLHLTGRALRD